MPSTTVTVGSAVGLHARPAAVIAQAATETGAEVTLAVAGEEAVDAGSALLIMTLGAAQGDEVTVESDDEAAMKVVADLRKAGIRVESDLRNEKINYKVREHSLAKVPVLFVVGKREADEATVAIRRLGSQGQEMLALDAAVARLAVEARAPDM